MFKDSSSYRPMTFSDKQVKRLWASDYGKPVGRLDSFELGRTRLETGGMTASQLASDIATNGIKNPLEVMFSAKGGMLREGHHRAHSGLMAGVKKFQAKVHEGDYQDLQNWKAKYTPPGQNYTWDGKKR